MEILTDKVKSTEEVKKELLAYYRIDYCSRTVREHIRDLFTLGWIKRVVAKDADMRKRFYQKDDEKI